MTNHYDRENLIDYIHGALAPEADAVVFAHLAVCPACQALHDEESAVGDVLRAMARAEEREMPSMVKALVWEAIRRERPSWAQRLRSGWGPRLAVPVAAAIALVAYFGVPVLHPQQVVATSGIDATYYLDEHNADVQQNPFGPGAAPAVYNTDSQDRGAAAASYIDTADAATLDDADGAFR